jgi:hypothetical protein
VETPSKGARISANRIDIRTMALCSLMSSLPAEIRTNAQLISPEHNWQPAYAAEAAATQAFARGVRLIVRKCDRCTKWR